MPSPDCSVVIPHLQGSRHLLACLHSLVLSELDLEIILVDNASTDSSVEEAVAAFPGITVVMSEENLGYAGGANLGLQHAQARWCIFLNDDAIPAPGALQALVARLERSPPDNPPLLQPALRSSSDPRLFDYAGGAGGLIDRWGYTFALGRVFDHLEIDDGQYGDGGPIAWASGCCMAGATSKFRDLGGFEESFFAHFEEIDLCWRYRRLGGAVESVPEAIVYHMGPSTLPAGGRKMYLNFRNNLWTLKRNLPAARLIRVVIVRVVLDAAAMVRWLITGKPALAWAALRGWVAGLFRSPWGPVVPERGIQPATAERGTYRGSIVFASYLRGVRGAWQILDEVAGR